MMKIVLVMLLTVAGVYAQAPQGTLAVVVHTESGQPVSQVEVQAGDQMVLTDDRGEATLQLSVGPATVTFQRYGFESKTSRVNITAERPTRRYPAPPMAGILRLENFNVLCV